MGQAEQPSFFEEPTGSACDQGSLRFGTSSFSSPDWVGPFYPRGLKPAAFLKYYATQFSTVEIDATYYHIPAATTVDAWAHKTPENFTIAAKFPRSIVHGGTSAEPDANRVLQPDTTYAERDDFLEVMRRLGKRLGPLLLQFPHFHPESIGGTGFRERLDRFLEDFPDSFQLAVEVRNAEWLDESFARLLQKHHVTPVLVDRVRMPHGAAVLDLLRADKAPFTYIRLLGDRARIEKITTTWDREVIDWGTNLERWAELLVRLAQRNTPTFVFANNHYAGHGPSTIRRLATRVRALTSHSPNPEATD